MKILYAILIAGSLLALNIVLLIANKRTPVPEGCENLVPDCKGCAITSCAIRNSYTKGDTKND
ncbi:MAG: hypothetical protein E7188_06305 [Erysipelotrichaceae bacterium]|nr:hypothetical protein [Erysipelotrichaceae bacterium]